jgi:hypothetical protein
MISPSQQIPAPAPEDKIVQRIPAPEDKKVQKKRVQKKKVQIKRVQTRIKNVLKK